ncbi:MAG: hypothetical protein ACR2L1_01925 [Pyrinomonadaceae bacterium]
MSENITESARVLLTGLIDYAGLFPPAALLMPEAVINYATYRNSNYNWMLGRFVVQVSKLNEFAEAAGAFFSRDEKSAWRLSVLAGDDIKDTIRRVEEFNDKFAAFAVCDALEIKAPNAAKIEEIASSLPDFPTAYFEISTDENLADAVSALAISGHRAKIRAGGVTADAFPTSEQIVRFMRTCLAANVPFKATAGLHHPVRCVKPLTYEPNAAKGAMHGFLNVFLAAAFLQQGFKPKLIREILEDDWAESFMFDASGVLWRQEYFLSLAQLKDLRENHAISFGSCSFVEPISDLQEIGIL